MNDITIEEAIERIQSIKSKVSLYHDVLALRMAEESLKNQKTGHWIAQDIHNCHTNFKCSECGYIHSFMHLYGEPTADYTYCPNCGAKMKGENNPDCRNCDKWKTCENGEKGHANGTSIGYSIGECRDYVELKGEQE